MMRPTPLEQGWVDAGVPIRDKNIDVVKDLNVWKKKVAKERNTIKLKGTNITGSVSESQRKRYAKQKEGNMPTANRRPQNDKLDVSQLERKPQTREQAKAAAKQIREWNKGSKKRNETFWAGAKQKAHLANIKGIVEKVNKKKQESAWKGSPLFSKEKRAKEAKQMKKSIANIRNTVQGVLARNKKKKEQETGYAPNLGSL